MSSTQVGRRTHFLGRDGVAVAINKFTTHTPKIFSSFHGVSMSLHAEPRVLFAQHPSCRTAKGPLASPKAEVLALHRA